MAAARLVCERLTGQPASAVIDVVDLGSGLLGFGDAAVVRAKDMVKGADLLFFASPTYKATYTGLLKLFLDQFGAGELAGCPTIAMMLGGSPLHALSAEYTLKPVLVEIGCSCPAPGLFLLDSDFETSAELEVWLGRASQCLPELPRRSRGSHE
jgi:FMN reductase